MTLERFKLRSSELGVYEPGEPIETLAERVGLPSDRILKLNANENLFLPRSKLQRIMAEATSETDPRLYPGEEEELLAGKLASLHDISTDQIVIGSGGDQIINLVISSILRPTDTLLAVTPTFSMYPRTVAIRGVTYRVAPLDNRFMMDGEKVVEEAREVDLIVLCNPNNPTSNQLPRGEVMKVVEGFDGPVLIDEAYAEFGQYSLIDEAAERDNLIILRTFSKAYGLAGLRLGYAVTNTVLARTLAERYMMPFSVPSLVLRIGVRLLEEQAMIREAVEEVKLERGFLVDSLNKIEGVRAFPSDTNFILFCTRKPHEDVYASLLERGVIVRRIGSVPGYENCLRVTVTPRMATMKFLDALKEVVA
ncbi:MAG TPA: histidinol-phosphate transaminase [Patescibacteria group bacterium]|nr:histidinol-phosphate transaminase [Patescibacteria group bacterium]